jgi:hypothetical protein
MKRSVKLTITFLVVLMLAFAASAYVHHFRPLISSTDWTATMKVEGREPIKGEVFYLLGRPETLFIRLPAPIPEDVHGYPWFSANTSSKFIAIPSWPQTTPYLHFNHDRAIGVGITDGKVGDDWDFEWTESGFSFWNLHRTIVAIRSKK